MNERSSENRNSVVWPCLLLLFFLCSVTVKAQTPIASFTADVQIGCAPLFVNFTNTSTGANSYNWNLGNGSNASTANPSAIYLNPGSYTVTLIATNTGNGQQSTTSQTITIVNNPIADFTISTASGCEDANSICFTNTSQFSASYTWDFGDGNTSTSANPCHTYANAGIYTVKLVAVGEIGLALLFRQAMTPGAGLGDARQLHEQGIGFGRLCGEHGVGDLAAKRRGYFLRGAFEQVFAGGQRRRGDCGHQRD